MGLPALDDFKQFDAPMPLRELVIVDPASPCVGMSVAAVLAEANLALGSCAAQLPAGALSDCAAMINESFVDGEAAARRSAAIAWRPPSPGLGRRRRRRASPTSASYAWETANCPTAATRRAVKRVTWPATTASVQTACTARPDAVCRAPADPLASALEAAVLSDQPTWTGKTIELFARLHKKGFLSSIPADQAGRAALKLLADRTPLVRRLHYRRWCFAFGDIHEPASVLRGRLGVIAAE